MMGQAGVGYRVPATGGGGGVCTARRILSYLAAPWWAQSMHRLLAFFERVLCGRALFVCT
jgi:hypothetical protein